MTLKNVPISPFIFKNTRYKNLDKSMEYRASQIVCRIIQTNILSLKFLTENRKLNLLLILRNTLITLWL